MAAAEVIKYSGSPDVLAWKYPSDELGTWTQLIVSESQEAILFKGGKALDIFESGTYTLDADNVPVLSKLINLPFGGRTPFTAEVWFINKANSLDIKWGTATPIQLQDPKYSVFIPVRAFGQFGIRIEDAKQFLVKLVGTLPMFDKENILRYFRGLYLTKVKDAVSSYLINKQISIMEINAYIEELSMHLQEKIEPTLTEYGIKLVNFYVNDISVPEDDSAVIKLKDALARKAEMEIIGYNYQQQRSFDTLEGAAKNNGGASSNIMGAGIGLGMGINMGGAVANQMGAVTGNLNVAGEETKTCPSCGSKLPEGNPKFCPECGAALIKVCPACKTPVSGSAKFCPECGQKLGEN